MAKEKMKFADALEGRTVAKATITMEMDRIELTLDDGSIVRMQAKGEGWIDVTRGVAPPPKFEELLID